MNYDFVQHIHEVSKLETMKKVLKDMKARMDIRNEFVGKAGSEYFRRNQEMKPVYQIGIDKCEARIKQLTA